MQSKQPAALSCLHIIHYLISHQQICVCACVCVSVKGKELFCVFMWCMKGNVCVRGFNGNRVDVCCRNAALMCVCV